MNRSLWLGWCEVYIVGVDVVGSEVVPRHVGAVMVERSPVREFVQLLAYIRPI